MPYRPEPAFAGLFQVFTGGPDSIGQDLARAIAARDEQCPLIVSTGSDIVLFPGAGEPASFESFRRSTRGFIELTAVSHVPLALAYLAKLRELDPASRLWRDRAARLIDHAERTRRSNTPAMWRDAVALPAFASHEAKIADLVEYTLVRSIDHLQRALVDEAQLSFATLEADYFDFAPTVGRPANMNDVMFATFALAYVDIAFRIGRWLREPSIDWRRAMVLVTGQSGRPTAGTTWASNNMCNLIWRASGRLLPPDRLYVAPHASGFSVDALPDTAGLAALESDYRRLWGQARSGVEVARSMFSGYEGHAFVPPTMQSMPPIEGLDDHEHCVARLRRIMEDAQQLISNCVADYIVDQLEATGDQPARVEIPGFSNVDYAAALGR